MNRSVIQASIKRRKGGAVLELCVCAPVIALLTFGTIDTCSMIYLKQSATIAAYEGGRTSIARGTVQADVTSSVQAVLDDRAVKGATIDVNPQNYESEPIGTFIEVSVTAPCESNSIFGTWFFAGRSVNGRAEFRKKY